MSLSLKSVALTVVVCLTAGCGEKATTGKVEFRGYKITLAPNWTAKWDKEGNLESVLNPTTKISASIFPNPNKLGAKELATTTLADRIKAEKINPGTVSKGDCTVGGLPAYRMVTWLSNNTRAADTTQTVDCYVLNGGETVLISATAKERDFAAYQPQFDAMINSLEAPKK